MILFYRVLTTLLYPVFIILIFFRKLQNKEDSIRYKEKLFPKYFKSHRKKNSNLIWFHAASIGELKSIFPIIKLLNKDRENLEFLITTITLSSANLATEEIKNFENIYHRFFPVDSEFLIKKFIAAWKPDVLFLVDSEIWPNLILTAKKNKIKISIINARITKKTFKRWMMIPKTAKSIFSSFDLCLSSSRETQEYLTRLNARNIFFFGNIKFINNINISENDNSLKELSKKNKIWIAVSTHKGEEEFCLRVHLLLKKKYGTLITIIAPRHLDRTQYIKSLCDQFKLSNQVLKKNEDILEKKEIIIINFYGMLSKFLNQIDIAFIGKSTLKRLEEVGGQSPIEAAKHGCKIYHGPYVYNFREIYEILDKNKISFEISDSIDLAEKIDLNFKKIKENKIRNSILIKNIEDKTLNNTMSCIKEFLNETI